MDSLSKKIPKDIADYNENKRRMRFQRLVKIVRFHRKMEKLASSLVGRILDVFYPIPWERRK